MIGETYTFGNNGAYKAERLSLQGASIRTDALIIPRLRSISQERYEQALEDINRTFRVLEDLKTGKRFEVAVANAGAYPSNGVDIELSTFTSSISGNTGNAIEFAENSALYPDRQRVYVASPGNGRTSYWDKEERNYIRRTGRFTQADGSALPTIAALNRVLLLAGFTVTRLSTNSAGGAYATALMRELTEGQVTHAFMKSRPNVSNHPMGLAWGLRVFVSDFLNDGKFKRASRDPWKEKLAAASIQAVRKGMPNVYPPESNGQHEKPGDVKTHSLGKMWADMIAFSHGGIAGKHPAARDTAYALAKQTEALVTYHFPLRDRIYNALPEDALTFLHAITMFSTNVISGRVEALLMPGAHRDHTNYPSFRWSIERYAFQRGLGPADTRA